MKQEEIEETGKGYVRLGRSTPTYVCVPRAAIEVAVLTFLVLEMAGLLNKNKSGFHSCDGIFSRCVLEPWECFTGYHFCVSSKGNKCSGEVYCTTPQREKKKSETEWFMSTVACVVGRVLRQRWSFVSAKTFF